MLTNTRRVTGSMRQSSLQRSSANAGQVTNQSPSFTNQRSTVTPVVPITPVYQPPNSVRLSNGIQQNTIQSKVFQQSSIKQNSPEYNEALQANQNLKDEMDDLINGRTEFGQSNNVVKLSHYNVSQADMGQIKEQEDEIHRLEGVIQANNGRIENYKKAVDELSLRMNNIQSIDKEIYKTLQGSVNRDKELLERASSALARGEKREDVAKILQQIIT